LRIDIPKSGCSFNTDVQGHGFIPPLKNFVLAEFSPMATDVWRAFVCDPPRLKGKQQMGVVSTTLFADAIGCAVALLFSAGAGADTKETVLHSFASGMDGIDPAADLIDVNGTLFGTTYGGGAYGYGAVFSLVPNTGAETVLHAFGNRTDGQAPADSLIAT
jgi:uncharacterized repeat protein (TIGR03803 family)